MDVSVVIPVYNEADSVRPLSSEIDAAFAAYAPEWECVWVDDGSTDTTLDALADLHRRNPVRHQYVSLQRRSGQSAALAAGFRACSGRVIGTLDGDLQNDPAELPRLVRMLERGTADLVTGIRMSRRDTMVRRLSSRIANRFRNWITDDDIVDVGCSLRAFYRECVADIPVFDGMHRFLPTLVGMRGFTVRQVPVSHRPRAYGRTKYGINNRLWRGIADCLAVRWMQSRVVHTEVVASSLDDTGRRRTVRL